MQSIETIQNTVFVEEMQQPPMSQQMAIQTPTVLPQCSTSLPSRSIFNIIPRKVPHVQQQLMRPNYDIFLNNHRYTFVPLEGYKESGYLIQLRDNLIRTSNCPNVSIYLELTCPENSQAPIDEKFTDAFFLLLAYRLSELDQLTLHQTICMLSMATEFHLPISYIKTFKCAIKNVKTIEDLFMFTNAAVMFRINLQEEGYTQRQIASVLTKAAMCILCTDEMNPDIFGQVAEALLYSWWIIGEGLEENMIWKGTLMNQLGRKVATIHQVPKAIMGSYVENMADEMIELLEIQQMENNTRLSFIEFYNLLLSLETFEFVRRRFYTRIEIMYKDLQKTIESIVRSKLVDCFLSWVGKLSEPISLYVTLKDDSVEVYPNLYYDENVGGLVYHSPTGNIDESTDEYISQLLCPKGIEQKLRSSRLISFTLSQNLLMENNVQGGSNDSMVLWNIRYPFADLGNLPCNQFTQYSKGIVNTQFNMLALESSKDPTLRKMLISMVC